MGPVGNTALRKTFFDGFREAQRHVLERMLLCGDDAGGIAYNLWLDLKNEGQLPECATCGETPQTEEPVHCGPSPDYLCDFCCANKVDNSPNANPTR